jgi:hypothetical protein
MKRAALLESIRRGISLHMMKRAGHSGAALVLMTDEGMKSRVCRAMADEILETIDAEHPGAIEP